MKKHKIESLNFRDSLMIGDLVHKNGEVLEWRYEDFLHSQLGMKSIEPIPITEDILKANGFVYDAINRRWDKDNLPFNGIKSYGTDFPFMVVLSGYGIELHYVHELQHVLRLCGITELANNFVVK